MELNSIKKRNHYQMGIFMVFVAYIILTIYFLLFAEETGRTVATESYNYNLELFKEIRRFWDYRETLGRGAFVLNVIGNVVCFIPMGIMLPLIFKKCKNILFTVFMVFLFSLTMEIIQLITKVGSFDVDDLFLNTLGGFIGCLLFLIFNKVFQKNEEKYGTRN